MKILFVCKGNVGRSQMDQAFYEKYSKNQKVRDKIKDKVQDFVNKF